MLCSIRAFRARAATCLEAKPCIPKGLTSLSGSSSMQAHLVQVLRPEVGRQQPQGCSARAPTRVHQQRAVSCHSALLPKAPLFASPSLQPSISPCSWCRRAWQEPPEIAHHQLRHHLSCLHIGGLPCNSRAQVCFREQKSAEAQARVHSTRPSSSSPRPAPGTPRPTSGELGPEVSDVGPLVQRHLKGRRPVVLQAGRHTCGPVSCTPLAYDCCLTHAP